MKEGLYRPKSGRGNHLEPFKIVLLIYYIGFAICSKSPNNVTDFGITTMTQAHKLNSTPSNGTN